MKKILEVSDANSLTSKLIKEFSCVYVEDYNNAITSIATDGYGNIIYRNLREVFIQDKYNSIYSVGAIIDFTLHSTAKFVHSQPVELPYFIIKNARMFNKVIVEDKMIHNSRILAIGKVDSVPEDNYMKLIRISETHFERISDDKPTG